MRYVDPQSNKYSIWMSISDNGRPARENQTGRLEDQAGGSRMSSFEIARWLVLG